MNPVEKNREYRVPMTSAIGAAQVRAGSCALPCCMGAVRTIYTLPVVVAEVPE